MRRIFSARPAPNARQHPSGTGATDATAIRQTCERVAAARATLIVSRSATGTVQPDQPCYCATRDLVATCELCKARWEAIVEEPDDGGAGSSGAAAGPSSVAGPSEEAQLVDKYDAGNQQDIHAEYTGVDHCARCYRCSRINCWLDLNFDSYDYREHGGTAREATTGLNTCGDCVRELSEQDEELGATLEDGFNFGRVIGLLHDYVCLVDHFQDTGCLACEAALAEHKLPPPRFTEQCILCTEERDPRKASERSGSRRTMRTTRSRRRHSREGRKGWSGR